MKYQYYLFNPRRLNNETAKLSNQVYAMWKNVYDGIFQSLHTDDFYRNEIITCIKDIESDKVVAFHMYSGFDARSISHQEHRYMDAFGPELIAQFRKEGATTFMTMEYLGVNPEYLVKQTGIKFADVISGLGMEVLHASPWDGLLAVARMDYKIHQKAYSMGMRPFKQIMREQYPCELLFMLKHESIRVQDPKLDQLVRDLWANRVSYLDNEIQSPRKERHLKVA